MADVTGKITNVKFDEKEQVQIAWCVCSNGFVAAQKFPIGTSYADMKAWADNEVSKQNNIEEVKFEIIQEVQDGSSNQ